MHAHTGTANYSSVSFLSSQGFEVEAPVTHLTRHRVVFTLQAALALRASELLPEFRVRLDDRLAYSGRAVISNFIPSDSQLIVEATLEDGWVDVFTAAPVADAGRLHKAFDGFLEHWQRIYRVEPAFKVLLADMQTFLADMRQWLGQMELGIHSSPSADRANLEQDVAAGLSGPTGPAMGRFFERFEEACETIEPDLQPAHRSYVKRQLHPAVLCAPFMHRTFVKPLGYAGDYEMVNMMMRDPREGSSLYAKVLNSYFLNTPPVVAHRNRLAQLHSILIAEVVRVVSARRRARVFSLGCGPAHELQAFLTQDELSGAADLTLLDFNDETVQHTGRILNQLRAEHRRASTVQMVRKNVVGLLKESGKSISDLGSDAYDLVYCSGLFDYMADSVCHRLMDLCYSLLAPGGLLVATNVSDANPSRHWMEYTVDWHLLYRNPKQMALLCPTRTTLDECRIRDEISGVNSFIEVRKPADG